MYIASVCALLVICQIDADPRVAQAKKRLHDARVSLCLSDFPCNPRFARCAEGCCMLRLAQPTDAPKKQYLSVSIPLPAPLPDYLERREWAFATSASRRAFLFGDIGVVIIRNPLRLRDDYDFPDVVEDILVLPDDVSSLSCPVSGLTDRQLGMFADRFKSLVCLELGANPITDTGLKSLTGLESLRMLDVSDTLITGDGFAQLKSLPALSSLSIGGCNVRDADVARLICELRSLEMVFLHYTECASATVAELARHSKMRVIDLSHTQVDDATINGLWQMETLEEVFLDGNEVSDAALAHVGQAKKLKLLSVRDTKVSDEVINRLQSERLKVVGDSTPPEQHISIWRLIEKVRKSRQRHE
jgi:hypothetical protein